MQLNTGAKVWLWIVFVLNIITCVLAIVGSIGVLALLGPGMFIATLASIAAEIVLILGVAMLLFKGKKVGFYLLCACAVIGLVLNLITGAGIVQSILGAVLFPLITYLLIKNQWYELS